MTASAYRILISDLFLQEPGALSGLQLLRALRGVVGALWNGNGGESPPQAGIGLCLPSSFMEWDFVFIGVW